MATPVRGTQSFVGVMGEVWRRPSLTAMEIAWRWLGGSFLALIVLPILLGSLGIVVKFNPSSSATVVSVAPALTGPLQDLSVFHPVEAVHAVQFLLRFELLPTWPVLRWCILAALLLWNLVAAFGRTFVLRRFDTTLHARRLSLFLLGTLRALLLAASWALWFWLLAYAANATITAPAGRNEEPHLVVFSAMLIAGTLFLYVAWGVFSWFLQLAPLLAMRENLGAWAALRAAIGCGKELRSKLIEINLVMHIVRLCLIVLAMVFSATPLPFADVTTPTFLFWWWIAVVLVYLAFSDYFHVVRAAAYLSLHRSLTPTSQLPVSGSELPAAGL